MITVFEYRYNYCILCSALDVIVYYSIWYNMDSLVNDSKYGLLCAGKWCLPKNTIYVIRIRVLTVLVN